MIRPAFYTWICTDCQQSGLAEVLPGRESERAALEALDRRHKLLTPNCGGELSVIDGQNRQRRLRERR